MHILFLSRSLRLGGAERQLAALARGLRQRGHRVSVAVFYGGGEFEAELRRDAIPVHDLGKRGRWDNLGFLWRTVGLVRRERPELLHSYLEGPNLVAAALRPLMPPIKLVWGVRSSMSDFSAYDWMSRASIRLEQLASSAADAVIANAEAARRQALAGGFPERKLHVVPNGIDCESFRFDQEGRTRVRAEWGIPSDCELVGLVARLDPVKNHAGFIRAAARVAAARPRARFVCVGGGPEAYGAELRRLASELGIASRIHFTGSRRATRAEYSAFDVAALSSDGGEGFPNVVAEAMACERPVAATDSGDVCAVVGDTGMVVPPRDPTALADALVALLSQVASPGSDAGTRARAQVEGFYSVEAMVRRSEQLLLEVLEHQRTAMEHLQR